MSSTKKMSADAVRVAMEAAGQAMFEFDLSTRQLSWADPQGFLTMLGHSLSEQRDKESDLLCLLKPEDITHREENVRRALRDGSSYTIEYALADPNGEEVWFEERGSWLLLGDSKKLIGLVRRINDQKQREEKLSWLARFDELTGQLNRSACKEILSDRLTRFHEFKEAGAYILIGIDNLGGINADFGFDVADEVIVETSRRLASVLDKGDALGRIAGTKFGIVTAKSGKQDIRTLCNKLLCAVREDVVHTSKGGIAISVCGGVVDFDKGLVSSDMVMARAESALHDAKRVGPSSWVAYSENTERTSLRQQNTEISDVILTALNQRRVVLAYQPIVSDLRDATHKYECLIRMREEDGTEVPAPAFIPAAERLGLVHLLDRRVLELATKTLEQVPDISLNVNISWETVKDPVWAEGYLAHLRAHRHLANRITVELTETQVVDALESSIEFVSEIKEIGCDFALDDFGAGYTSFRNLKALDIDVLKIDGSFVTGVSSSRDNQLFVRTLLDLARNFGMKTVAEWVDNDADAMLLKGLGVDYLQGFYIGKPKIDMVWDDSLLDEETLEIMRAAKSESA